MQSKNNWYLVFNDATKQHRIVELIGMKITKMDDVWLILLNPFNQSSCTAKSSISMKPQNTGKKKIMKMVLIFTTYLKTVWIVRGPLTIGNIALVPLFQ